MWKFGKKIENLKKNGNKWEMLKHFGNFEKFGIFGKIGKFEIQKCKNLEI